MVLPETYPGGKVFVNSFGITDARTLSRVEAGWTTKKLWQIYTNADDFVPPGGSPRYDLDHLKAIHRHLFQGLYHWAGEQRSYGMRIKFRDEFTPPEEINEAFRNAVEHRIHEDGYLVGKQKAVVIQRLAKYLGLTNMIHPSPDGNGRAQRAFIWLLAYGAGYKLLWNQVADWENEIASQNIHRYADYTGLERIIERIMVER